MARAARGARVADKELNRLRDHMPRSHGTFPAQAGWMTVANDGNVSSKEPANGGEPLVQSVRTYLADEPHKLVVRVLTQPEPQPQPTDVQIIPDATYAESADQIAVLKRNDLNNNSKNKITTQKNTEENHGSETNRPVDPTIMPSTGEHLQRQPLLARNTKPDTHISLPINDDSDPDADEIRQPPQQLQNGDLHIMESVGRDEPYPREFLKFISAFVFLFLCTCINMCSLAIVHEKLRLNDLPLPDVFLDNIPAHDWALSVSEYILMTTTYLSIVVIVLHRHRFIVLRRIFFIMGLLYLYRSVTMYVTVFSKPSTTYFCNPQVNHTTPGLVFQRMFYLMSGFGLSVNGKHVYCGDYLFSGHTMIFVLGYLVISEYSPKKWWILHYMTGLAALLGVIFLMLAHGHYTIDVIVAYYITTRLFWSYHSMTMQYTRHRHRFMITREWWYRMFLWFEQNVHAPLPRQYNWPLPWPKFFVKLFR